MPLQKLYQIGFLALEAGEVARIDPELRSPDDQVLVPTDVAVTNGVLLTVQGDPNLPDYGTFRIQNIANEPVGTAWVAKADHSIQKRPGFAFQEDVGTNGLVPDGPGIRLFQGALPNALYLDAAAPAGGNGSVASPYKTFAEATAYIATQPINNVYSLLPSGDFVEDVIFPAQRSYVVVGNNFFKLTGDVTLQKDGTGANPSIPRFFLWFRFQIFGSVIFEQVGTPDFTVFLMEFGFVSEQVRQVGDAGFVFAFLITDLTFEADGGTLTHAINHPTMQLANVRNTTMLATVEVAAIARAIQTQFTDVVVSFTPPDPTPVGLVNCALPGGWSGPAGSAVMDAATQKTMLDNGGTLSGGATMVVTDGRAFRPFQAPEVVPASPTWGQVSNGFIDVDSDTLGGSFFLPVIGAEHEGQVLTIKRRIGTAAALTIDGNGALIDGAATIGLAPAGAPVTLCVTNFGGVPAWGIAAN